MASEQRASGCIEFLVILLLLAAASFVVYALNYKLTRQDDWIRDLQRRVGQLEQQR